MDRQAAIDLIARNRYCVLAAASTDGQPWAAPLFYNCDAAYRLIWESSRDAFHSKLIEANPRVSIVIADLDHDEAGEALYFDCLAQEVPSEELEEAIKAFKAGPHTKPECAGRCRDDYGRGKPLALYEAVPEAVFARTTRTTPDGYQIDERVRLDLP